MAAPTTGYFSKAKNPWAKVATWLMWLMKIALIRLHEADQVIEAPHLLHIGRPHTP
jgi:hypothetical protein